MYTLTFVSKNLETVAAGQLKETDELKRCLEDREIFDLYEIPSKSGACKLTRDEFDEHTTLMIEEQRSAVTQTLEQGFGLLTRASGDPYPVKDLGKAFTYDSDLVIWKKIFDMAKDTEWDFVRIERT